jgi:hypothetical protein
LCVGLAHLRRFRFPVFPAEILVSADYIAVNFFGSLIEERAIFLPEFHAPVTQVGGTVSFTNWDSKSVRRTSLQISTVALAGDDTLYANLENQLSALTTQRDSIAAQIIQVLEAAEFSGQPIDSETTATLVAQAEQLIGEVEESQQTK